MKWRVLWEVLWIWIAAVSAYDLYRCVLDQGTFMDFEMNPLVRAIVYFSSGNISLFVGLKSLGTTVTLASLLRLRQYKHIWIILWSIAAMQLFVLATYCPFLGILG